MHPMNIDQQIFWSFVKLLISLPVVLALAYFGIKIVLANKKFGFANSAKQMKLIEQLALGPKTVLSIVKIGEDYYLVGSQDNSVNLLKELKDYQEKSSEQSEDNRNSFKNIYSQKISLPWQKSGDKGNKSGGINSK